MKYTILAYADMDKKNLEYTIMFDAVISASESYTNQITSFTVEDGGVINDHAIKTKDKITIEGIVTDLSFNQGEDGLVMFNSTGEVMATVTEDWSKKVKESLLAINDGILPCSFKVSEIVEGQEVIESEMFPCLIETLNLDRTGGQYGFIQPKITLVPVRIARLQFEKLTAQQEAIPELKNQNPQSSDAKAKSGSTDGSGKSEDGKEVDLDLTKSPEQTPENKSMIGEISNTTKKMADVYLSSEKAITQAEIDRVDKRIADIESRKN